MLIEIVLALGYNGIDKRLRANETEHSQTRKKQKQSIHNRGKKNSALTTEKKGKIEREYSQIETVQLGYFFFLSANYGGESEEQWRRR